MRNDQQHDDADDLQARIDLRKRPEMEPLLDEHGEWREGTTFADICAALPRASS